MSSQEYERPLKLNAVDVINYEIHMLQHCSGRVREAESELTDDQLAHLEAFLLHFRILLEFFGKPSRRYPDNLYFKRPSGHGWRPSSIDLERAAELAHDLDQRYNEKLNKFLAHPTERRHTTPRSWNVEVMLQELQPLLAIWRRSIADSALTSQSNSP